MGDGSVAAAASAPRSWRLEPEHAQQTQGLVVRSFAHLHAAEALFLTLPDNAGGAWLQRLREHVPISDAAAGRTGSAAAIAFTCTGLAAMGLDAAALASFSTPFREGMHQIDRRRRLGDDQADLVIPGGARWSGNTPDDAPPEKGGEPIPYTTTTPMTVHAVLLLYREHDATLDADLIPVETLLRANRVAIAHRIRLSMLPDATGTAREHFGFADGMSQPVPIGDEIVPATGPHAEEQRTWHGVAPGEILIGHRNAHREPAPGPLVAAKADDANPLPSTGAPEGFRNLGLNGSYLVIRELRQDVATFWQSMDAAAAAIGDPAITAEWIADRIVGRTRDGDVLAPGGTVPREDGRRPANNFGFVEKDMHGLGCPLGSHIRRANPRDSLPSRDGPRNNLIDAVQSHRILRRGRKFGLPIADLRIDDGQDRGLLFMCLNTDLERHFEFIQQTWMLNQNFATLLDETDPLMGPKGRFTIPRTPLRHCPVVQTFVQFAGGEYFFLPSMPALEYLSTLTAGARP
jgi:deferrochelatase/peroxidase EfeB